MEPEGSIPCSQEPLSHLLPLIRIESSVTVFTIEGLWNLCWNKWSESTSYAITIPRRNYPPNETSQEVTSDHGFRLSFCAQASLRRSVLQVSQVYYIIE
jgi:hypothetical protein